MNLRENINKIHFNLSNQFDDVKIEEKSNIELGSCVEMTINESEKQVRLVVTKKSLENYRFDWKYLSNPLNESSTQVERTSNVDDFTADIKDIFDRNRFDSDYLRKVSEDRTEKEEELEIILNDIHSDIDMSPSFSDESKKAKLKKYIDEYPQYESEIIEWFNHYILNKINN